MNRNELNEAIKQEIQSIIDSHRKSIRYARQYAAAKWQIAKLTELGILDLMPSGFQHGDAGKVIEAAEDASGAVFNAYGEGEDVAASNLHKLLNTEPVEETEDAVEPEYYHPSENEEKHIVAVTVNDEVEIDGVNFFFHEGSLGVDPSTDYLDYETVYVASFDVDHIEDNDQEFQIVVYAGIIAKAKEVLSQVMTKAEYDRHNEQIDF